MRWAFQLLVLRLHQVGARPHNEAAGDSVGIRDTVLAVEALRARVHVFDSGAGGDGAEMADVVYNGSAAVSVSLPVDLWGTGVQTWIAGRWDTRAAEAADCGGEVQFTDIQWRGYLRLRIPPR